MIKKYIFISIIASTILCMENNNKASIPAAPSIVGFYKREMQAYAAKIQKIDLALEQIAPSMEEWLSFQKHFPTIKPELYKEKSTIKAKILSLTYDHAAFLPSKKGEIRLKFEPNKKNDNNSSENKQMVHEAEQQLAHIDLKIHYELKCAFLKKCQENK